MKFDPTLILVEPIDIDRYWFLVEHKLGKALSYSDGKYTLQDVYNAVKKGIMQLWVVKAVYDYKAVMVTEVIEYPSKRVLVIMFLSGQDFDSYKQLFNEIERFGLLHRCESVEFYGRTGWKNKIKNLGFEQIHTVFRSHIKKKDELNDERTRVS